MARLILGVTGSVAAIRTPELFAALRVQEHLVRVVATEPALYFFDAVSVPGPNWKRRSFERAGQAWPTEPSAGGSLVVERNSFRLLPLQSHFWLDRDGMQEPGERNELRSTTKNVARSLTGLF